MYGRLESNEQDGYHPGTPMMWRQKKSLVTTALRIRLMFMQIYPGKLYVLQKKSLHIIIICDVIRDFWRRSRFSHTWQWLLKSYYADYVEKVFLTTVISIFTTESLDKNGH